MTLLSCSSYLFLYIVEERPAMGKHSIPPSTELNTSMTITWGKPLIALIEAEGALVGMKRAQFIRAIITWHMGRGGLQRAPGAPTPKLPKATKHKLVRIQLNLQQDLFDHIHKLANEAGNVSRSAILALIILRWVGVDVLAPPLEVAG